MKTCYAALCCYFGQWPEYFQTWLNSCRYNRGITFYMVSDIPVDTYLVPDNVRVIPLSFIEVRQRVQTALPELNISLERPYKLCDYKPAYGRIFADLFEGHDYWGYYDIDTVWGDIEKFIPDNADKHLIKIFPCGHLSFIKNISPYNSIFEMVDDVEGTPCRNNMTGKKVVGWKECYESPESYYYDEEGGLEPFISAHPELSALCYQNVDFDNILPPWRFDHFYSINFPEKSHCLVYSFEDGHLYRHYLNGLSVVREEISYLHISKRRMKVCSSDPARFSIYPNRIVPWRKWNVFGLLLHGRTRRLRNILNRIKARI